MEATCKIGSKGCWPDGKCRYDGECSGKIITNADRIRAMSDEELAEFIQEAESCGQEGASVADWGVTMLEWLRNPAEEVQK